MRRLPQTYDLYRRLAKRPLGSQLFSVLYALKAPYFRTVRPQVRAMAPHRAEVEVRLRWGVRNHIGTLHAIAAVNGLEAAMGLLAEATCPSEKRWIPVGMTVRYVAKATTDLLCVAETSGADWEQAEVPVRVTAVRRDGVAAVEGVITVRVSERPKG
jgi:acyl-coenzyme A thioesterase PaaI-like protein